MSELAELQGRFQKFVVEQDASAVSAFVGNAAASAETRLGVYFAAYRLRLVEILREDYPGLAALLGDDEFATLGLRYLERCPSTHPSVRQFGRHFADFVAQDDACSDRDWLAEMARFEWNRGLAFDGPDADRLTLETLGALPADDWPDLTVKFQPTLQRSVCHWNIGPIWRAVDAGDDYPAPERLEHPVTMAIWRKHLTLYWRSLDDTENRAVDAFAAGQNFAEVCELLCAVLPADEVPALMAGYLHQWVSEGLVTP